MIEDRVGRITPPAATYTGEGEWSDVLSLEWPAWHTDAACRGSDPNLFYPGRGEGQKEAFEVCRRCPVRVECLEYALEAGEKFGIWGGYSERARRRMRRARTAGMRYDVRAS